MNDRVNITAAADEHTATAREEHERGEFEPLDVAVWRRSDMPSLCQVEFLLTSGGPTVRVTVDEQGGVEFFHSWGVISFCGQVHARTRCDFRSEDAEFWRDLAAQFAEAQLATSSRRHHADKVAGLPPSTAAEAQSSSTADITDSSSYFDGNFIVRLWHPCRKGSLVLIGDSPCMVEFACLRRFPDLPMLRETVG